MTQNPYKQGMEAQNAGKPIAANPYPKGRTDWTRWRGGWQYAKQLQKEREAQTLAKAWVQ